MTAPSGRTIRAIGGSLLIHLFTVRSRTMPWTGLRPRTAVALTLLALTLNSSCASKDNSTAPAPNTTESFNYTFPAPGQSIQRTFTTVGSIAYHCAAHESDGMTGTVVVSASASLDSQVVLVAHNDARRFTPAPRRSSPTAPSVGYAKRVPAAPRSTITPPPGPSRWRRRRGTGCGTPATPRLWPGRSYLPWPQR